MRDKTIIIHRKPSKIKENKLFQEEVYYSSETLFTCNQNYSSLYE